MQLREWTSDNIILLNIILSCNSDDSLMLRWDKTDAVKTMGIQWNPEYSTQLPGHPKINKYINTFSCFSNFRPFEFVRSCSRCCSSIVAFQSSLAWNRSSGYPSISIFTERTSSRKLFSSTPRFQKPEKYIRTHDLSGAIQVAYL